MRRANHRCRQIPPIRKPFRLPKLRAKGVVDGVSRFVAFKRADNRMSDDIQIADGVEDFVAHKLIGIAQAFRIQDIRVANHDGVVQIAA